jgi:hypothetical protein
VSYVAQLLHAPVYRLLFDSCRLCRRRRPPPPQSSPRQALPPSHLPHPSNFQTETPFDCTRLRTPRHKRIFPIKSSNSTSS